MRSASAGPRPGSPAKAAGSARFTSTAAGSPIRMREQPRATARTRRAVDRADTRPPYRRACRSAIPTALSFRRQARANTRPPGVAGERAAGSHRPAREALLGQRIAGATELLRKVLELRQPVAHRHHLLAVVHMHGRAIGEALDRPRGHVRHVEARMPDQHRRTAGRAELAVAILGPLVEAELVGAFRHLDVRRRPQARRVDRGAEPATAGSTVAVHLNYRVASDLELDRAARAAGFECVRHGESPSTAFERTQPRPTTVAAARELPWAHCRRAT